ncbi:hypothetical protein H5410_014958 [Solanum commersonii]|uniref:Uncharacterized protein n=1 Tax=Solanum commersonii TaxID=4109 RepID=A0A9J5ZSD6_SOLCO|nr:hypothetical protein H5410_014958 [Solanum commersonii]
MTLYNNFWDKLMKRDPNTKLLYRQKLLDLIEKRIQEYCLVPQKRIIQDSSVRHIARKISIQDGDKEEMINNYLDEVRRNLLLNITQYEKFDTSMRSETSDDVVDIQEAQLCEPTVEDALEKAEDLLCQLKRKDNIINAKGFSATYENQNISYTFITDPISRDINALIDMKQKHVDSLQLELFSMNIFELLQIVKDPEIRAQIIDNISNTSFSQNITEEVHT